MRKRARQSWTEDALECTIQEECRKFAWRAEVFQPPPLSDPLQDLELELARGSPAAAAFGGAQVVHDTKD